MARRSRPALVAAANAVRLGDESEARRLQKARAAWQSRAYEYLDEVGELKHATAYVGNALSKLRLFAAVIEDPEQGPVAAEDTEATSVIAGFRGTRGGHPDILRHLAMNLFVVGEDYLVYRQDKGWGAYSIDEVSPKTDGTFILAADGETVTLKEPDRLVRVHRPHPRKGDDPDSPVRGVMSECEELLLLERARRASLVSRIAQSGILFVSEDLSFAGPDPAADSAAGDPAREPFMAALTQGMTTAIQNEGTAAAVAPLIVRGGGKLDDRIALVEFSKPLEAIYLEAHRLAVEGLARGVELPVEIVTGLMSTTFANAHQVSIDTFRAYLEPFAIGIVDACTDALFGEAKPGGVDDRIFVWFDATGLTVDPNRGEAADAGHDKLVLSDEAWLTARGFAKEDKPSAEELARRLGQQRGTLDPMLTEVLIRALVEAARARADGEEPEANTRILRPVSGAQLIAAAPRSIGSKLLEIDRELRARLQAAAEAAMSRALERAGNRARSRTAAGRRVVERTPPREVIATLGRAFIADAGITEADLLEGAFTDLEASFTAWVSRAQAEALALVTQAAPGLGARVEQIEHRQAEDRSTAWTYLLNALNTLAASLLYDPTPEAPAAGEYDADARIPVSIIRDALAIAGGSSAGSVITAQGAPAAYIEVRPSGGVATGLTLVTAMQEEGGGIEGYVWTYGAFPRTRPFEPHEALDGLTFTSWDDPALANPDSFPETPFYFPGDHQGCVVGDTRVSGPPVRGATLRRYEGELIELTTASGEFLAITPNHPVLTSRGWVPAGALREGDDVVCSGRDHGTAPLVPDQDQRPAQIQEIFAALPVPARVVPVAPQDFHGDGQGDEVYVVRSDRSLEFDLQSPDSEPSRELAFARTGVEVPVEFAGQGTTRTAAERIGVATLGSLSGGHVLTAPFEAGLALPDVELGSAVATQRDPGQVQLVQDRAAVDGVVLRESLRRFAGEVAFSELVKVNRLRSFSGHVYNLQTLDNWYAAAGIIVHNCICDAEPVLIPAPDASEFLAPGAIIESETPIEEGGESDAVAQGTRRRNVRR